jgi:hypothetical protein
LRFTIYRMRKAIVIFLLSLLAVSVASNSEAQFWKKKSHRKKHSRKHEQPGYQADVYEEQPLTREQRKLLKKKQRHERRLTKRERKHLKKQKVVRITEVAVAAKDEEMTPRPRREERESDNEPTVTREERKQIVREEKQGRKTGKKKRREPVVPPVVKVEFEFPRTQMKNSYRIDVLASLYLDDIIKEGATSYKGKIPEKAMPGMAFYKGVQIAADSLKNAGFNIDIYIHDVTSDAESAQNLISGKKLDSADLLLGAVQPRDIPELADYAKGREVNFVSAFSPNAAGVKDNHYFTLVQPSLKTHCEWITADAGSKFPGQNVTLLYRTADQVDDNAYKYVTDAATSINLQPLNCNTLPGKSSLAELIDPKKPNVVIVSVLDKAYADSLLAELSEYFPSTHFEVYGMPSWAAAKNGGDYDNLSINVTTPFNFDASSPVVKYINKQYRKEFTDKPTELVYRGFEALFWYANLLKEYGTIFNEHYKDNSAAPFTKFEVRPERDKDGNFLYYENKHMVLIVRDGGPIN